VLLFHNVKKMVALLATALKNSKIKLSLYKITLD
jgi:hypothetical protein